MPLEVADTSEHNQGFGHGVIAAVVQPLMSNRCTGFEALPAPEAEWIAIPQAARPVSTPMAG
jgi:hypothetical protein